MKKWNVKTCAKAITEGMAAVDRDNEQSRNYEDVYCDVSNDYGLHANQQHLEATITELGLSINAAKKFRKFAKAAPQWESIKSLIDQTGWAAGRRMAAAGKLATLAHKQTVTLDDAKAEYAAQKKLAEQAAQKKLKASGTSAVSVKTLEKLAERITVSLGKDKHLNGLDELLNAVTRCIEVNGKASTPAPADKPTQTLEQVIAPTPVTPDPAEMMRQFAQFQQFMQMQK